MAVTRSGVLGRMNSTVGTNVFTLFTVPAGMTYIVKDVAIQNQSGITTKVVVWIQNPGDTIECVLQERDMPAREIQHLQGWWAAGPGDQFIVDVNAAGGVAGVNVWASGAALPGHI